MQLCFPGTPLERSLLHPLKWSLCFTVTHFTKKAMSCNALSIAVIMFT